MNNLKKQAKSDIFKILYPIITFYIKKGATPIALRKYYKRKKRFNELLDDIRYKSSNLVNEDDYKNLVKEILTEILDDLIAKEKDNKYNLKYIKEFNKYERDTKHN